MSTPKVKVTDVIQLLNANPVAAATPLSDAFKETLFSFLRATRCNDTKPNVEDNYLRCSAVAKVLDDLPRLRFAQRLTDVLPVLHPNTVGAQLNFDVGHAVHEWWQNQYVANFPPDSGIKLWGDWACGCNSIQKSVRPADRVCLACKQPYLYCEIQVKEETLKLKGHPDGLLVVGEAVEPTVILEIKTIATQGFEGLTEAVGDHRRQVHCYMKATGLRDVLFVYVDKGKQSLWKYNNGSYLTVGEPRVKFIHETFNDALWADMEKQIIEFWTIYDRVKDIAA